MCIYKGYFKNDEIMFTDEHIFYEQNEVLVRGARNTSEENDRLIPLTIKLKDINMDREEKNKLFHRFFKKEKKIKNKTRPWL